MRQRYGIIIGAGIAGLTAALAFQQRGISYTLYEAASELREVGAGIWMASNAMQVFQRLGISKKVMEAGIALEHAFVTKQDGRPLQSFDFKKVTEHYGVATCGIHRGRLQKALLDSIPGENIKLNKRLRSIEQKGDQVTVTFDDGDQDTADFVVGADGIRSAVRREIFGEINYRYSGQTCWRGIARMKLPESYRKQAYEMWGNQGGLRFGFSPVDSDHVYFFTTLLSEMGETDETGTIKEKLKRHYSCFGSLPLSIIDATEEDKIIRSDILDFKPIDNWRKGKVVLLGDAAHATTPNLGQGGCQAVEDGYVIAKCLSEISQIEEAFDKYQSIRYGKATYVVNTSWRFSKMTNLSNPLWQALRNQMLKSLPESWSYKALDRVYKLNY